MDAGWQPEPFWTIRTREISVACAWIWIPDSQFTIYIGHEPECFSKHFSLSHLRSTVFPPGSSSYFTHVQSSLIRQPNSHLIIRLHDAVFVHTGHVEWWIIFFCINQEVPRCVVQGNRKNVKQSHYRPGHARRVPGGWGSQILTL